MSQNILVTGANAGIGRAISNLLLKSHPKTSLIFTYRNEERGKKALEELKKSHPKATIFSHQLDVSDAESIRRFVPWSKKQFPNGLQCLINNAGIASKGSEISRDIAQDTFNVNYYGLKHVTESLYDQIVDNGRVVNVSSGLGQVSGMDDQLKKKFLDSNLTEEQLDALVTKFLDDIENNQLEKEGWIKNSYAVSKLAVNMWTRIRARDDKRNITYVAICPGWCRTNMGGSNANRSDEEGAQSVLAGVFDDAKKVNGGFFRDGEALPW
eukprot:CAMPEP_0117442478 /NCGR_PEP_ID=MMETSP0759-20121206/4172_1 /TAXON_ID=63605 /ORGANISM="Percolomonas cosmopolitus, Strain WS" /LENGTH=267 /DNA_ID=CAMNT_0005234367 /DNA_START=1219 /DNA_END=2019 /DNA_ORIENTATION=+